jgi:hypothetical protein
MFDTHSRKFMEDGITYDRVIRNAPRNLIPYYTNESDIYSDREYETVASNDSIFSRPHKMNFEGKEKNFFGEDLNENGELGAVTWTTSADPRWIAAKETYHRLTNNHSASLNATVYKVNTLE